MYSAVQLPTETRKLIEEDVDCPIAIGTDTMSVGVDLSCFEDVVAVDDPEDVDDLFQKYGRVGHNKKCVTDARGILYLAKGSAESAKRIVDAEASNDPGKLRKGDTMDISIAQMVLANCKVDEQNQKLKMSAGVLSVCPLRNFWIVLVCACPQ
jgi:Lhr-like helicase